MSEYCVFPPVVKRLRRKKITPKQERFLRALVRGITGVQAASEIYNCSSYNSAASVASQLLALAHIQERFQELLDKEIK